MQEQGLVWCLLTVLAVRALAQSCMGALNAGFQRQFTAVDAAKTFALEWRMEATAHIAALMVRDQQCKGDPANCDLQEGASDAVEALSKWAVGDKGWERLLSSVSLYAIARHAYQEAEYDEAIIALEESLALRLFAYADQKTLDRWQQGLVMPGNAFRRQKVDLANTLVLRSDCLVQLARVQGDVGELTEALELLQLATALLKNGDELVPDSAAAIRHRIATIATLSAELLPQLTPTRLRELLEQHGVTCSDRNSANKGQQTQQVGHSSSGGAGTLPVSCADKAQMLLQLVPLLRLPVQLVASDGTPLAMQQPGGSMSQQQQQQLQRQLQQPPKVVPEEDAFSSHGTTLLQRPGEHVATYMQRIFFRLLTLVPADYLAELQVLCRRVDSKGRCISYLPAWVTAQAITIDKRTGQALVSGPGACASAGVHTQSSSGCCSSTQCQQQQRVGAGQCSSSGCGQGTPEQQSSGLELCGFLHIRALPPGMQLPCNNDWPAMDKEKRPQQQGPLGAAQPSALPNSVAYAAGSSPHCGPSNSQGVYYFYYSDVTALVDRIITTIDADEAEFLFEQLDGLTAAKSLSRAGRASRPNSGRSSSNCNEAALLEGRAPATCSVLVPNIGSCAATPLQPPRRQAPLGPIPLGLGLPPPPGSYTPQVRMRAAGAAASSTTSAAHDGSAADSSSSKGSSSSNRHSANTEHGLHDGDDGVNSSSKRGSKRSSRREDSSSDSSAVGRRHRANRRSEQSRRRDRNKQQRQQQSNSYPYHQFYSHFALADREMSDRQLQEQMAKWARDAGRRDKDGPLVPLTLAGCAVASVGLYLASRRRRRGSSSGGSSSGAPLRAGLLGWGSRSKASSSGSSFTGTAAAAALAASGGSNSSCGNGSGSGLLGGSASGVGLGIAAAGTDAAAGPGSDGSKADSDGGGSSSSSLLKRQVVAALRMAMNSTDTGELEAALVKAEAADLGEAGLIHKARVLLDKRRKKDLARVAAERAKARAQKKEEARRGKKAAASASAAARKGAEAPAASAKTLAAAGSADWQMVNADCAATRNGVAPGMPSVDASRSRWQRLLGLFKLGKRGSAAQGVADSVQPGSSGAASRVSSSSSSSSLSSSRASSPDTLVGDTAAASAPAPAKQASGEPPLTANNSASTKQQCVGSAGPRAGSRSPALPPSSSSNSSRSEAAGGATAGVAAAAAAAAAAEAAGTALHQQQQQDANAVAISAVSDTNKKLSKGGKAVSSGQQQQQPRSQHQPKQQQQQQKQQQQVSAATTAATKGSLLASGAPASASKQAGVCPDGSSDSHQGTAAYAAPVQVGKASKAARQRQQQQQMGGGATAGAAGSAVTISITAAALQAGSTAAVPAAAAAIKPNSSTGVASVVPPTTPPAVPGLPTDGRSIGCAATASAVVPPSTTAQRPLAAWQQQGFNCNPLRASWAEAAAAGQYRGPRPSEDGSSSSTTTSSTHSPDAQLFQPKQQQQDHAVGDGSRDVGGSSSSRGGSGSSTITKSATAVTSTPTKKLNPKAAPYNPINKNLSSPAAATPSAAAAAAAGGVLSPAGWNSPGAHSSVAGAPGAAGFVNTPSPCPAPATAGSSGGAGVVQRSLQRGPSPVGSNSAMAGVAGMLLQQPQARGSNQSAGGGCNPGLLEPVYPSQLLAGGPQPQGSLLQRGLMHQSVPHPGQLQGPVGSAGFAAGMHDNGLGMYAHHPAADVPELILPQHGLNGYGPMSPQHDSQLTRQQHQQQLLELLSAVSPGEAAAAAAAAGYGLGTIGGSAPLCSTDSGPGSVAAAAGAARISHDGGSGGLSGMLLRAHDSFSSVGGYGTSHTAQQQQQQQQGLHPGSLALGWTPDRSGRPPARSLRPPPGFELPTGLCRQQQYSPSHGPLLSPGAAATADGYGHQQQQSRKPPVMDELQMLGFTAEDFGLLTPGGSTTGQTAHCSVGAADGHAAPAADFVSFSPVGAPPPPVAAVAGPHVPLASPSAAVPFSQPMMMTGGGIFDESKKVFAAPPGSTPLAPHIILLEHLVTGADLFVGHNSSSVHGAHSLSQGLDHLEVAAAATSANVAELVLGSSPTVVRQPGMAAAAAVVLAGSAAAGDADAQMAKLASEMTEGVLD